MGDRQSHIGGGRPSTALRLAALIAIVGLLTVGQVAPPIAGAQTDQSDTAFVVSLAEDGSADVTLRLSFDLEQKAQREALSRLRENRTDLATEYRDGLAAVAARTETETGREMAVTDASTSITTERSTGIVELSVTWEGLAAVEGDRLVIAEPFADGFHPQRTFVIEPPSGYALASASTAPTTESGDAIEWAAGSSLDGFQATFAPADAVGDGPPSQSLPGFGFPAAFAAVALVAGVSVLLARRRS